MVAGQAHQSLCCLPLLPSLSPPSPLPLFLSPTPFMSSRCFSMWCLHMGWLGLPHNMAAEGSKSECSSEQQGGCLAFYAPVLEIMQQRFHHILFFFFFFFDSTPLCQMSPLASSHWEGAQSTRGLLWVASEREWEEAERGRERLQTTL